MSTMRTPATDNLYRFRRFYLGYPSLVAAGPKFDAARQLTGVDRAGVCRHSLFSKPAGPLSQGTPNFGGSFVFGVGDARGLLITA